MITLTAFHRLYTFRKFESSKLRNLYREKMITEITAFTTVSLWRLNWWCAPIIGFINFTQLYGILHDSRHFCTIFINMWYNMATFKSSFLQKTFIIIIIIIFVRGSLSGICFEKLRYFLHAVHIKRFEWVPCFYPPGLKVNGDIAKM